MNRQTATKTYTAIKLAVPALMALAALASVSCEDNDPVAIDDSIITVTAQPNPVAPGAISTVQALVTTASGVPEQDVAVIFSATNGTVTPDSDLTDSQGRAFTSFTSPSTTTATVTARSGSITGQVSITINANPPSQIQFTTTTTDQQINSCGELIVLTGRVVGSGGTGVAGALVQFRVESTSTPSGVTGNFTPQNVLTDANGDFSQNVNFDLNPSCSTCAAAGTSCTLNLQAFVGSVNSPTVTITETF